MRLLTSLTVVLLIVSAGCGRESLKEQAKRATNKAGELVGEGASSFFTGVGEGVDKTVTSYDVRLSEELKAKGVSVTIAKHTEGSATSNWQHGLSFYVLNKTSVSGGLRLKLFNDKNQEVGRATTPINLPADNAKYVAFTLDKEIPVSMTKYVELDLKRE